MQISRFEIQKSALDISLFIGLTDFGEVSAIFLTLKRFYGDFVGGTVTECATFQ